MKMIEGRADLIDKGVEYAQSAQEQLNHAREEAEKYIDCLLYTSSNTVKQPFYATIGASVTAVHNDCSLTVWGENLTDAQYDTFYFVSIGNAFLQKGKPMRAGVTLRMNF